MQLRYKPLAHSRFSKLYIAGFNLNRIYLYSNNEDGDNDGMYGLNENVNN